MRTPVAVAAVRGTDLALHLDETGALKAGVIEGEVAFEKPEEASTEVEWDKEDVVLKEDQGIVVEPNKKPVTLDQIPSVIVSDLVWFETVSERVKKIQVEWNQVDKSHLEKLRENTLSQQLEWEKPGKIDPPAPNLPVPSQNQ